MEKNCYYNGRRFQSANPGRICPSLPLFFQPLRRPICVDSALRDLQFARSTRSTNESELVWSMNVRSTAPLLERSKSMNPTSDPVEFEANAVVWVAYVSRTARYCAATVGAANRCTALCRACLPNILAARCASTQVMRAPGLWC